MTVSAVVLCALTLYTCVGAVLGAALPVAAAVPLAVLAAYGWVAYAPTFEVPWLRHLTGSTVDCCVSEQQLAPPVISALALLAAGAVTAAMFVVGRPFKPGRWTAAVSAASVAGICAVLLVDHLSYSPTVARTTALECAGESPVVCVWPEHADQLPAVVEAAKTVTANFDAQGISLPNRATESFSDPTTTWSFVVNSLDRSDKAVEWGLISGLIPQRSCEGVTATSADQIVAALWLAKQAGTLDEMTGSDPSALLASDLGTRLTQVEQMTPAQRGAWWASTLADTKSCSQ